MTSRLAADMPQVASSHRRAKLGHVMASETKVTVRNPITGKTWENVTIIGLLDEPGMLIEREDGTRWCLPQSLAVEWET
jgi:hypothetical protein